MIDDRMFVDPITNYTDDQAIKDGVLHHVWPDLCPWLLLTDSVFRSLTVIAKAKGVEFDNAAFPLILVSIKETTRLVKFKPDIHLIKLENTILGTVFICPNSKGGMTIMLPEDRE